MAGETSLLSTLQRTVRSVVLAAWLLVLTLIALPAVVAAGRWALVSGRHRARLAPALGPRT